MEQKYLLNLAYEGTDFHGWQIQKDVNTIQAELESCLTKIFKSKTSVIGSGRTDAGVHAINQYAHFTAETRMTTVQITLALNSLLPESIYIKNCQKVDSDFHSRFKAKQRTYIYKIGKKYSPFVRKYAVFLKQKKIEISRLNNLSKPILGKHNFEVFAKDTSHLAHCFCHIYEAKWQEDENFYLFKITGNRFLHSMVRRLMGTFIKIYKEELPQNYFETILSEQDADLVGKTYPPHGLYLYEVKY